MAGPDQALRLRRVVPLLLVTLALSPTPARALDLGYACRADADAVFGVASEAAQVMPHWRSIRVVDRDRTVKAVVRGWRNIAVPVWIQVRASRPGESDAQSELHVLWEQSMEPLNDPDLTPFFERFDERQRAQGLDCVGIGTDVGL